jgi:hypothetical protein
MFSGIFSSAPGDPKRNKKCLKCLECLKFDGSVKVVTPVKTGVQGIYKPLKILDSGFRRNDRIWPFQTFYETIKFN